MEGSEVGRRAGSRFGPPTRAPAAADPASAPPSQGGEVPMPSHDRRAAARRRAWGRGPIILRFELLEGRQLLATTPQPLPDLVSAAFDTLHNLDWGDSFHAVGQIGNQGQGVAPFPFHV